MYIPGVMEHGVGDLRGEAVRLGGGGEHLDGFVGGVGDVGDAGGGGGEGRKGVLQLLGGNTKISEKNNQHSNINIDYHFI